MTTSNEKGDALEKAVRAIEMAILNHSPALRENAFNIQSKKRITVENVRHELDLYVEVDLAQGYKAIYIFECKNWQPAVGKNDIIIFSEKIDATGAQKGFFVAKSFSKDAEAQAKKDNRIELLVTAEYNDAAAPAPFDSFHHLIRDRAKMTPTVEFHQKRLPGEVFDKWPINPLTAQAKLQGVAIDLNSYLQTWLDELTTKDVSKFQSGELPDGTYERIANDERAFEEAEFSLNDREVTSIKLRVSHQIEIVRAKVVSHFEVATRGRVIVFAPVPVGDGSLQVSIVSHN